MSFRASSLALGAVVVVSSFAPLLTGCSSADGAISVEPATTSLTDKANDALFTVKLDEAREGGYALEGLAVKVKIDDGDTITSTCVPNDTNTNKRLDQGETLSCSEGATNVFDAKSVGKEGTVQLFAKIDDKEELVGDATWTPK